MEKGSTNINICSTYLLPLLNLNRFSFGERSNFVDSYLNSDNKHLIVQLRRETTGISKHPNFRFTFEKDSHIWIVYEIPEQFYATVEKFREGKFSKFDEPIKAVIKQKSGLKWRVPKAEKTFVSAFELLALDKDEDLRGKLEDELNVKISADAELMSIPSESNYIHIEWT